MSKMHSSLPLAVDSPFIQEDDVGKIDSLIERPKEIEGRTRGSRRRNASKCSKRNMLSGRCRWRQVWGRSAVLGRLEGFLSINLENKVPTKSRQNSPVQAAADS